MIFYESHHFFMFYIDCHRECLQKRKYFKPVFEITASKLTNDERMTDDMSFI